MDTSTPCPCNSGDTYRACCNPYHTDEQNAPTAAALMRSRYAAYVLDNTRYIQETWHTSTRPSPDKINFADEKITWNRLEILSTKKGGANDAKGIVEFKAYYTKNGEDHVLHEASRFLKNNGRWFYLDGAIKSVGKIILQANQGKNAPCPCGSGKKFKRCCGSGK